MIEKKKRKGTRAKGRAFEKRCADILEEYGFQTFIAPPKLGWYRDPKTNTMEVRATSQDIFGCIDIIAKSRLWKGTIWIQCGETHSFAQKKRDVQGFPGWTDGDLPMVFIKNPDRTISVFCLSLENRQTWADIGKFDNRRNWIATPAYPLSGFGVRTPKKRKVKNG